MGAGPARGDSEAMTTLLLHPTAYRAATDDELVDRVRAGDGRAFDAIHERYAPRLVAYARQMLGGAHHDAEEVVQDAFVRALSALRADEREMALKPWLYTIVRNRALDVLRRPVRTTDLELHAPVLPDRSADPHERVARSEDLRALVDDLHRLPERQREALVLHELGGASHATIARRLDVSTGGSKALVCRARSGMARLRAA
jgi:RNA polymerase sigma-70 factor, ECF subfamily